MYQVKKNNVRLPTQPPYYLPEPDTYSAQGLSLLIGWVTAVGATDTVFSSASTDTCNQVLAVTEYRYFAVYLDQHKKLVQIAL